MDWKFDKMMKWDSDPYNCFRCDGCPHNTGAGDLQGTDFPCGQYYCFVSIATSIQDDQN